MRLDPSGLWRSLGASAAVHAAFLGWALLGWTRDEPQRLPLSVLAPVAPSIRASVRIVFITPSGATGAGGPSPAGAAPAKPPGRPPASDPRPPATDAERTLEAAVAPVRAPQPPARRRPPKPAPRHRPVVAAIALAPPPPAAPPDAGAPLSRDAARPPPIAPDALPSPATARAQPTGTTDRPTASADAPDAGVAGGGGTSASGGAGGAGAEDGRGGGAATADGRGGEPGTGGPPGRGQGTDPVQAWLGAVRGRINAAKRYPLIARRLRLEGTVKLHLRIDARGHLLDIQALGDAPDALREAALAAARRAAPFPPPPDANPVTRVEVPLRFSLTGN